jgi:hypothetical protein
MLITDLSTDIDAHYDNGLATLSHAARRAPCAPRVSAVVLQLLRVRAAANFSEKSSLSSPN